MKLVLQVHVVQKVPRDKEVTQECREQLDLKVFQEHQGQMVLVELKDQPALLV